MRSALFVSLCCVFFSCTGVSDQPDVSAIKVDLKVQRFEKGLFELDSLSIYNRLDSLLAAYPSFGDVFMTDVLNCDPRWSDDTLVSYVYGFTHSAAYHSLYDTAEKLFGDFNAYEKKLAHALQFQKYYFPQYPTPEKLITYIGPLDGQGDGIADNALVVGLHHHLGATSSFYQNDWLQTTYPSYITRRFEPASITVNCMSALVRDMYPDNNEDATLIDQMVEKGKRLYILQKLLPEESEHLIIGYSEVQLKDCYDHEDVIWNFFGSNNLLQSTDYNAIKNYVNDGPKTQEFGEDSPGNIGSFVGWQIVKKFMKKNSETSLTALMKTPASTVIDKAKYKP